MTFKPRSAAQLQDLPSLKPVQPGHHRVVRQYVQVEKFKRGDRGHITIADVSTGEIFAKMVLARPGREGEPVRIDFTYKNPE